MVILSSSDKLAIIKELTKEPSVEALVKEYMGSDFDLFIVEGYKTNPFSKIEIFRPELYDQIKSL